MGNYRIKDILSQAETLQDAVKMLRRAIKNKLGHLPDVVPFKEYAGYVDQIPTYTAGSTIKITENGNYWVGDYESADINVQSGGDPDYRYMNGGVDRDGLRAIGWTDEDILRYEQNALHYEWQNDQFIVSEGNKALYRLDDPQPSYYNNDPYVTFVPNKNMEAYFAKVEAFKNMEYIKGIPWYDTSNVTNMTYMFQNCKSLISIPQLDTSKVTNMSNMFSSCSLLQTIPQLDTSNVTTMGGMFSSCSILTIPQLDTSKVTNMSNMFSSCSLLQTIPQLDTSSVTYMSNMFGSCSLLQTIPQLDTSSVTDMSYMFSTCNALTTVEGIDFSGFTSPVIRLFGFSSTRPNITHFIVNGKINVSISDNYSIKALNAIDYDSVKSILTAASKTDNTDAKTLTFNRTIEDPDGTLQNIITICTGKGWTITGLTLN